MNQKVVSVLVGLVQYITTGRVYRSRNHYSSKPVVDALLLLCDLSGHSNKGYDYLDVVELILEGEKDVPKAD